MPECTLDADSARLLTSAHCRAGSSPQLKMISQTDNARTLQAM